MEDKKVLAKEEKKQVKETKNQKSKKPNFFVRVFRGLAKAFRNMWQELKKVSWPTWRKVLKQTGVVLGVVLFFLVFITAFDFGLQKLMTLITDAAKME